MSSSSVVVTDSRPPWIYKRFVKEKLFVRERYWRTYHHHHHHLEDSHSTTTTTRQIVLPNGIVWRKYLKLWMAIAERCSSQFQLVLLESAVELMDWRNASPSIIVDDDGELVQESAAIQEKNRLRKLVEGKQALPFCDLSVREDECDEFQLLDFAHMSLVDRSNCALMRAARMLRGDDDDSDVLVIVDSRDDMENDGVNVQTMDDFLALLPNDSAQEMEATKKRCEDEYQRRNAPSDDKATATVEEYLTEEEIYKGLRDGSLARGRLDVSKQNQREGYVSTSNGSLFVNQEEGHFNRAIHQDVVIVRPLPENQWGCPIGRRRLVFNADSEESDPSADAGPTVPSAIVVSIAEPSRRQYVATLVDSPASDERAVIVVPMDTRIPRIRIQTKGWQRFLGQRLLVEIDSWDVTSNYPNGHCVEILGPYGELETEIACLLLEQQIRFTPFSASAIASLPPEGPDWRVPSSEISSRRDLRKSRRIFSVDPSGCQDIDDTMHAKVLPNGDIEVGVHIADVTHFVAHNSALDKEAQSRATTFYLVDRRFDMLPTLLSSDLCSLHGNTDRLAVSVIWIMSSDFEQIKSTWYGRTVIRNCQAMTYEQAHNIIHDQPPDDPSRPQPPPLTAGYSVTRSSIPALKEDLTLLTQLTRKLRKRREEIGGAVDLSSGDLGNELKFALDANGNPTKVAAKKELEIHHTIAELMILANQSVAEKIFESFPDSSLLRVHRSVEQNRFDDLKTALKAGGISFDGSSNMALAKSLKNAKQTDKERSVVNALWQSLATRAMMEALYVSTGDTDKGASLSHYGLGIEKYTHFTSPIRRYADVVVHKQLLAALANDKVKLSTGPPPGFVERKALESIPDSAAISVMKGEGLKHAPPSQVDDEIDFLISGAADMALGEGGELIAADSPPSEPTQTSLIVPYEGVDVAQICENLNEQNRRAKLSSMECQKLFLSLFFKNEVDAAKAVVTDLRENGFVVFVPKFDMRGAVWLRDISGSVQVDPTMVGLPLGAGLDPTLGFAAGNNYRRFPTGQVSLVEDPNDAAKSSLEVLLAGAPKTLQVRVLDVVTVQISCDFSDVKARIPQPRIHLIAPSGIKEKRAEVTRKIDSGSIKSPLRQNPSEIAPLHQSVTPKSMYRQLAAIPITPNLPNTPTRPRKSSTKAEFQSNIGGRKTFGLFVNPDTRAAQQEAAVSAASTAAAQRRVSSIIARRDDFDKTRNMEQSVMARTQKLAAGKRNARIKSKGK